MKICIAFLWIWVSKKYIKYYKKQFWEILYKIVRIPNLRKTTAEEFSAESQKLFYETSPNVWFYIYLMCFSFLVVLAFVLANIRNRVTGIW